MTQTIKKTFLNNIDLLLGPNGYATNLATRIIYSRDANYRDTIQAYYQQYNNIPAIVMWPENTEQVSKLIKLAIKHRKKITTYGGGSGVCGGATPLKDSVVLDTKKLKGIIKLDTDRLYVDVQAGTLGLELEKQLARKGYTLGHFPVSILNATVGGYLATKAAGQFSSKYGKIEDLTIDIEFVDGKGRIIQTSDLSRSNGLDLTSLILGSEGTLGIITKARLKIFPKPTHSLYMAYSFPNMKYGIEAQRRIIQTEIKPDVLRLYDKLDTAIVFSKLSSTGLPLTNLPMDLPVKLKKILRSIKSTSIQLLFRYQRLIKEFSELSWLGCMMIAMLEGDKNLIGYKKNIIQKISEDMNATSMGENIAEHWYRHRYSVAYKVPLVFKDGGFTDTMEVSTTWDNLIPLYKGVLKKLSPHCLVLTHITHVYTDGASIYFTFVAPLKGIKNSLKSFDNIWQIALDAVQEYSGTISHHNGIGKLKTSHVPGEWQAATPLIKALKEHFDPHGVLNKDVLFE